MDEAAGRPSGWRRAAWVAFPAGILGVAVGAGLIVRDCALTCNVGYRLVPLAWLAIAGLALPFVALQLRWLGRVRFIPWQVGCAFLAALGLLAFRAWTWQVVAAHPYADPTTNPVPAIQAAYLSYYVWIDPVLVLLITNLVRLEGRVYGPEAEAGIAPMAGALMAGGLAGSGLAKLAIPALLEAGIRYENARDHLLVLMALCLLLYALAARRVGERFPTEEAEEPATGSLRAALGEVLGNAGLRRTAGLLVLTGAACIALEYLFLRLVSEQVDPSDGRTEWFAGFYLLLNAVSLALLLFGTRRLLERLGLLVALALLPLALFLGGLALLAATSLVTVCALRIGKDGLLRTLYEPACECLILRQAGEQHGRVRTTLGGLAFSAGMGLAALGLLALSFGADASPATMTFALLGLVGAWGLSVGTLRGHAGETT